MQPLQHPSPLSSSAALLCPWLGHLTLGVLTGMAGPEALLSPTCRLPPPCPVCRRLLSFQGSHGLPRAFPLIPFPLRSSFPSIKEKKIERGKPTHVDDEEKKNERKKTPLFINLWIYEEYNKQNMLVSSGGLKWAHFLCWFMVFPSFSTRFTAAVQINQRVPA